MLSEASRILNGSEKRVPAAPGAPYRGCIMRSVFVLNDCRGEA